MCILQWTYGGPRTNCRSWFSLPTMLVLESKLRSSALVLCLYALSHSASLSPIYKWNLQRYLFVMSQVFPDSTWWSWKVSPGRWNSELSQHYLSNLTNEFRPTVPLVLTEPRNQGLRAGPSTPCLKFKISSEADAGIGEVEMNMPPFPW